MLKNEWNTDVKTHGDRADAFERLAERRRVRREAVRAALAIATVGTEKVAIVKFPNQNSKEA